MRCLRCKLGGKVEIEVAVPTPVGGTFTYVSDHPIAPGTRVLVPFGARKLVGVALGPGKPAKEGSKFALKKIAAQIDQTPVYSEVMLKIAHWMSQYYMHPIGEVVRAMLPASATHKVEETVALTKVGLERRDCVIEDEVQALLKHLFSRQDELKRASMQAKLGKAGKKHAAWQERSLKWLLDEGLVTLRRGTKSVKPRTTNDDVDVQIISDVAIDRFPVLTAHQQSVLAAIRELGLAGKDRRPFALLGVTGSGKTEVYLNLIRCVLEKEADGQCLVLVPEISLTPQMTRVFSDRFPKTVAVVHSAMTDTDRWAELGRIRSGEARILIGPRSAVFGPFQKLRLILVDEEHDSSYKQTTGLSYNGRDTAVLRGKWENATVVLGSATLSMETYHNAKSGKYHLLEMPERVTGRALPDIKVLAKSPKANRVGESIRTPAKAGQDEEQAVEPQVLEALRENLKLGQQSIVLVNRRGYAYYLFSLDEKQAVSCPQCSISLTLHNHHALLRCHYCDFALPVAKLTADRPDETFVAVGYGSQKAEAHLSRVLPEARIVRLDSDTVTKKGYLTDTLSSFRKGDIDILVGTQILAKGHDFPNVTLIVILEVDQLLNLPDFRAGERTFQLIVQAAGRAGRAELAGRVLIQTVRPGHEVVRDAITQNYKAFAERELQFREEHSYPPFSRFLSIEMNAPDKGHIGALSDRIDRWVEQMMGLHPEAFEGVRVLGPAIPAIEQIRGRHRRSLLIASADPQKMHRLAYAFQTAFPPAKLSGDIRLKFDVDPQSLI